MLRKPAANRETQRRVRGRGDTALLFRYRDGRDARANQRKRRRIVSEQAGGESLYEDASPSAGEGAAAAEFDPGWYTYFGGIRFHDGEDWVGDPHPPVQTVNYWLLALAAPAA
jgi:hypothetical protein